MTRSRSRSTLIHADDVADDCLALEMGLTAVEDLDSTSVELPQRDGNDHIEDDDCRLSFLITRDLDSDAKQNDDKNANANAGFSVDDNDDEKTNILPIARTIMLLRQYEQQFGMPAQVSAKQQALILREINTFLYAGGVPLWVLANVMTKAAEGLTGKTGIHFWLLPRKTLIIDNNNNHSLNTTTTTTDMYTTVRGFAMFKLDRMAPVAIRVASFASRSKYDHVHAQLWTKRFHPEELRKLLAVVPASSTMTRKCQGQDSDHDDADHNDDDDLTPTEQENLAAEILNSASTASSWFSFLNREESVTTDYTTDRDEEQHDSFHAAFHVTPCTREIFHRLVALEALHSIQKIRNTPNVVFPFAATSFFHMASAAGASAIWFNGSWQDMVASAFLSLLVAAIKMPWLRLPERIALEVIASFLVGLFAGLVALQWPNDTCFGAMSLAGVLDILHGFKIVFAIMEIMSRHTVAGGADLLEGILFTGMIAYFLQCGQYLAVMIAGQPGQSFDNLACEHAISEWWYFIFVPLAAMSWSGLFLPSNVRELLMMGFHGTLGFTVSWAISHLNFTGNLPNFVASAAVTFSAGIIARWTGRQAVGNIVAGIFGLVPGAYLVRKMYSDDYTGFIESTVVRCIMIGIGAAAGIALCSPRILGKKSVLCSRATKARERMRDDNGQPSMLFF